MGSPARGPRSYSFLQDGTRLIGLLILAEFLLAQGISAAEAGWDFRFLTAVGDRFFFTADDGVSGRQLWVHIPDSGGRFRRGYVNFDGSLDISDGIAILRYLFLDGDVPGCLDAADVDDSGILDLSDAIGLFQCLFLGGSKPLEPFSSCGEDPSENSLGCEVFWNC